MILPPIGTYPTPVERLRRLERGDVSFWVKRDDQTHPDYGGNKVRKLEHVLPEATRRGATRIVTVGAVGSHHVLATTLFGRRAGFHVEAILVPQPGNPYVEGNLRIDLGLGLDAGWAPGMFAAPFAILPRLGRDAYFIPVGGTSVLGALGYVDAAHELARQIRAGELPKPDVVVVTVGSGGTAVGLAVGFAEAGLDTRVLGVCVADPVFAVRMMTRWLVQKTAARVASGQAREGGVDARALAERARHLLRLTPSFLGKGYAAATPEGTAATRVAAEVGLTLEPTYTAKTFAGALAEVERGQGKKTVLYWHTLSSAPLGPLLEHAPPIGEVRPALRRLLR